MASQDALDLSHIDPPVWRIMVADVAYGPYTLGQMRSFVEEGRLSPTSNVSSEDGGAFLKAFEHAALRPLFSIEDKDESVVPEELADAANFMISVRTDGEGRQALIALLNELGQFSELMSGTFILNAEISITQLREQFATVLAERGKVVIVNAGTGQLAWIGLGSDADHHAQALWKRDG